MRNLVAQLCVVIPHMMMIAMPASYCAETNSQTDDVSVQRKEFLGSVAPTLRGWKTFEQWANSLKGRRYREHL